jgi:hypothetical protein
MPQKSHAYNSLVALDNMIAAYSGLTFGATKGNCKRTIYRHHHNHRQLQTVTTGLQVEQKNNNSVKVEFSFPFCPWDFEQYVYYFGLQLDRSKDHRLCPCFPSIFDYHFH